MRWQKFKIPALGVILGAIGATHPMSSTPGGVLLALTGILGLLTLINSRGDAGMSIRRHAFFTSLWIAVLTSLHNMIGLGLHPDQLPAAIPYLQFFGYAIAVAVVVLSFRFIRFAYRHRNPEKRNRVLTLLSVLSSAAVVMVWLMATLTNLTLFVPQLMISTLSPPVISMLNAISEGGQNSIVLVNEEMTVTSMRLGVHSWSCPDPTEILYNGQSYALRGTDQIVLERLCAAEL